MVSYHFALYTALFPVFSLKITCRMVASTLYKRVSFLGVVWIGHFVDDYLPLSYTLMDLFAFTTRSRQSVFNALSSTLHS